MQCYFSSLVISMECKFFVVYTLVRNSMSFNNGTHFFCCKMQRNIQCCVSKL